MIGDNRHQIDLHAVGPWATLDNGIKMRRVVKLPPLSAAGRAPDYRWALEVLEGDKITLSTWSETYATEDEAAHFADLALADFIRRSRTGSPATAMQADSGQPPADDAGGWLDRDHHTIRAAFPAFSVRLFGRDLAGHFLDHAAVRQVCLAPDMAALHLKLADGTRLKCHARGLDLHGPHNDGNIGFIIDTAQALGWKTVTVTGSPDFIAAVSSALIGAGISVTGDASPDLASPAFAAAQHRPTAPSPQPGRPTF